MTDYQAGNLSLCNANDSALIIIDIQTRLTATMPIKVLARLKRNSSFLIKAAGLLAIPVLATEQYPKGLGPLEPEIVDVLPENTLRFEKTCFSCVGAENFMEQLENTGRKQIILMGIEAHVCVLQTAIDLLAAGFHVFVIIDAVSSRHRENYEAALQRMRHAGVTTCNAESVLFEWLRDAKHEHFKTLSAMVK
ncbi:MAG: hydrolase [Gammaproteobacteria bacterium]